MPINDPEDLIYRVNVDYVGFYTEEDTKTSHPVLSIRLYIFKEALGKTLGINISSIPSNDLYEAINDLSERFSKWFFERYHVEGSIKEELMTSKDLKRKFENWIDMKHEILMQQKTIDVTL